ncbi:hypothetical protein LMG31506_01311 [Cupriavidus yeoncheonensis]|uniref:Uncharacterized protein n=1 Tax=Cupriavidus yeoncheonensis TaxID=1462994 RepID=A0A916ISN7_9BURK|nr:hypothetical protein [Cupriavidus yeoncheonensis]CAG2134137.1 hypothetical protein LMG31506_01311 [Cupriavidus yeoncheonensis]
MDSPSSPVADDPRLGACAYLIHMLLQRAEQCQPGLLDSLLGGVSADRDAVRAQGAAPAGVDAIFAETLRMLELASAQLKAAGKSG